MQITIVCGRCGAKASVPDSAAGAKGKCRKCGGAIVVPSLVPVGDTSGDAAMEENKPHEQQSRRLERLLIAGGIVVGFAIVMALVYFLFLRDKWENDHRDAVIALATDASALARQEKLDDAKAKLTSLFGLVGDHQVRDETLQSQLQSAHQLDSQMTQRIRSRDIQAADAQVRERQRIQAEQIAKQAVVTKPTPLVVEKPEEWKPIEPQKSETVLVTYDRFKDSTQIETADGKSSWVPYSLVDDKYQYERNDDANCHVTMAYIFSGRAISKKPESVGLLFSYNYEGFKGEKSDEDIYFIVDGISRTLSPTNLADTQVNLVLPIQFVQQLVAAKSVEVKIGFHQFKLTDEQLRNFGQFLNTIGMQGRR